MEFHNLNKNCKMENYKNMNEMLNVEEYGVKYQNKGIFGKLMVWLRK